MRPTEPTRTPAASPTRTPTVTALATLAAGTPPPASTFDPTGWPEAAQARADLAQRLNVLAVDIEIVDVQEVTWPDSSLGCPQPGLDYLQVETPGVLVRLAHAGQTYDYHSGGGQPPFLCEQTFPGLTRPAP